LNEYHSPHTEVLGDGNKDNFNQGSFDMEVVKETPFAEGVGGYQF